MDTKAMKAATLHIHEAFLVACGRSPWCRRGTESGIGRHSNLLPAFRCGDIALDAQKKAGPEHFHGVIFPVRLRKEVLAVLESVAPGPSRFLALTGNREGPL